MLSFPEMFRVGDKVLHQGNRDLGPGEVVAVESGRMRIHFPRMGETLLFSLTDHAFTPLMLPPGTDPERWAEEWSDDLAERLLRLEVDPLRSFRNRLDGLRLRELREAGGLGSYLGGRIRIFPHQLHVAELATRTDPVRWLLADEVGLGKTVEACLVLSHLLRTGRVQRVLVLAPGTLVVQWLGELYRKFHQVFVLLDEVRRADVRKDLGNEFNPFEVHAKSVAALEDLVLDKRAARSAVDSRPDLLVVDEAHRLERRPGHPGSPAYRAIAPLARAARHVLLLSATPIEADTHGFYRLLELLRPEEFPSWEAFQAQLAEGRPLYPCTSSTRRADIGGLPPRVPLPVPLPDWPEQRARETVALSLPAHSPNQRRSREEALLLAYRRPLEGADPRLDWIVRQTARWKRRKGKTLLFVSDRSALDLLKREIEFLTPGRVALFHEDLSLAQRDLEVAHFAQPDGPTLLISTEAGGEGRNFEFCRRLVLFDMPWNPGLVEQRIGRLDRISRTRPVEIVYFVPAGGFAGEVVRLYERLGIFREPLGGLERSLSHVEDAIRSAAHLPEPVLDVEAVLRETREAHARTATGIYRHLHRNRYRPELAEGILSRIPQELDELNEQVVVEACRQFGFDAVHRPEQGTWYFEFGPLATIDGLPGISAGQRWLGTFDRETAVARETLDFFAAGHSLVEGILTELADGHRGQVALLEVTAIGPEAPESSRRAGQTGLLVVVRRGPSFEVRVHDAEGKERPEWLPFFRGEQGRLADLSPSQWRDPPGWPEWVRSVLQAARRDAEPVAVAGFRFGTSL